MNLKLHILISENNTTLQYSIYILQSSNVIQFLLSVYKNDFQFGMKWKWGSGNILKNQD
jgi:hypothetical protein